MAFFDGLKKRKIEKYLNEAFSLIKSDEYKKALVLFSNVIEIDSVNSEALFGRASILASMKEDERALKDINASIKYNPNNPSAYCLRGSIYLNNYINSKNKEELSLAITDFHTALKRAPDFEMAKKCMDIANEYLMNDVLDLINDTESVENYLKKAKIHNEKGEFKEELNVLSKGIEQHPDSTKLKSKLILYYVARGNIEMAIEHLNTEIELGNKTADAYALRGTLLLQMGKPFDAHNDLAEALRLNPDCELITPFMKEFILKGNINPGLL